MIKISLEGTFIEFDKESLIQLIENKVEKIELLLSHIEFLEASDKDVYLIYKLFSKSIPFAWFEGDGILNEKQRWYGDLSKTIFFALIQYYKEEALKEENV